MKLTQRGVYNNTVPRAMRVFSELGIKRADSAHSHLTRERPLTGNRRSSTEKFPTLRGHLSLPNYLSPGPLPSPFAPDSFVCFVLVLRAFDLYTIAGNSTQDGCCCCPDAHPECHVPLSRRRLHAAASGLLQIPGSDAVRAADVERCDGMMLMDECAQISNACPLCSFPLLRLEVYASIDTLRL